MTQKLEPIMTANNITPVKPEPLPDPFNPQNLRLSTAYADTVGVKKLLTTVPVRKSAPQDFVRVHAGAEWRENFALIELKDDREQYLVTAELVPELAAEVTNQTLFLTINRQGVVFFWPIRLPGPDGKDMDWWRSARDAAERATQGWLRVKANSSLGAYEVFAATAEWPEPEWPGLDYWALIRIAFKDRLIDSLEHPVVKRLRGQA